MAPAAAFSPPPLPAPVASLIRFLSALAALVTGAGAAAMAAVLKTLLKTAALSRVFCTIPHSAGASAVTCCRAGDSFSTGLPAAIRRAAPQNFFSINSF